MADYLIEGIVGERQPRGQPLCHVRFRDLGPEFDEWQRVDDVPEGGELVREWKRNASRRRREVRIRSMLN